MLVRTVVMQAVTGGWYQKALVGPTNPDVQPQLATSFPTRNLSRHFEIR